MSRVHIWILVAAFVLSPFTETQAQTLREYRDVNPSINLVDPIPVLSADKAAKLEEQIKELYARLSPSVVRIWTRLPAEAGKDENDQPLLGGSGSGVIISEGGLILTCAHSGIAPKTAVTIELSDGRRLDGITLGRFELYDAQTFTSHPDLGLVRIEEEGQWPAAEVGPPEGPEGGEICLAIGYPGSIPSGSPPLVRLGRVTPRFPEWPWLMATTTYGAGDSGGPLFDLKGRVLGVVNGGEFHAPTHYQPVAPFHEFRDRLVAEEIVTAPSAAVRALQSRSCYPSAFQPALDLEDTLLSSNSVVRILDGTKEIAMGVVVEADGWVLTKRTLIDGCKDLLCTLPVTFTGKLLVSARVVASSKEHDLALLKMEEAQGLPVAKWSSQPIAVGQLVTSLVGRAREPVQIAVVSANVRPESPPATPPQLMVDVVRGPNGEAVIRGIPSFALTPEADSFRRSFKAGDIIKNVDGFQVSTFADYARATDQTVYATDNEGKPDYAKAAPGSYAGEPVIYTVERDGDEVSVRVTKVHASISSPLLWNLNPLSIRRDGFPATFSHDGRIRPEQCGGPVIDLAGNVIGINIARADSTRTLAIPADVAQQVVAELLAKAKSKTVER